MDISPIIVNNHVTDMDNGGIRRRATREEINELIEKLKHQYRQALVACFAAPV